MKAFVSKRSKIAEDRVVAAASFVVAEVQVKYEKYDWFMPTSLRPLGHC
jgi:hypothetical protein